MDVRVGKNARRAAAAAALSALLLALTAAGLSSHVASGQPAEESFRFFRDEAEAPWAIPYLARASARGLLSGYPGRYFCPGAGVRRAEVLVALMRLVPGDGQRPSGEALSVLPDGEVVARSFPWAADAVDRATYLGIIDGDEPLEPGLPASRLWIAELVVKALGLDAGAQEEMQSALPFSDSADIPPEKTGYVAVVNRRGIMTGYNGLFEPLKNITRAEFATVLDRCSEVSGPVEGVELRGRVTAVDSKKSTVSLRVFDHSWWKRVRENGYWDRGDVHSHETTLPVAHDAAILLDDKEVALSSVKKDHIVSLVWNSAGYAVMIDAKSKPPADWPEIGKSQKEGTVVELKSGPAVLVFKDAAGKPQAYGVASNCRVKRNDKAAELKDIATGDRVKLRVTDSMINSIEAEEPEETIELEGVVKGISLGERGRISLQDDRGVRRDFGIAQDCSVTRSGRPSNLIEVRYNDVARIRVAADKITRITVLPREGTAEVEGAVRELKLGPDGEIRIRDAQLEDRVYELSPYCTGRCGGRYLPLEDVHVNDVVLLELEKTSSGENWLARTITVRETGEAGGFAESVEAEFVPPRIRVRLYSGGSLSAWILPGAKVWRKGKLVKVEDIDPGDRVKMTLLDGVATRLEIEDSLSAIEGVVEEVDARRRRLTVRPQDEQPITLTLADNARLTYVKQPVGLDEVKVGDRVQVKLRNALAASVDVEDRVPREVSGQVTRLSAGSSPKVWIKPTEGSATSYALAADVKVEYDGLPLQVTDILKDDRVVLRVYGSRVTRVIIDKRVWLDVQGTVVSVLADLLEGYSLRIRNTEGDVITYRVKDDAPIRKGSVVLDWGDLKEGCVVDLRVAGNVVTRITVLQ